MQQSNFQSGKLGRQMGWDTEDGQIYGGYQILGASVSLVFSYILFASLFFRLLLVFSSAYSSIDSLDEIENSSSQNVFTLDMMVKSCGKGKEVKLRNFVG